jgi:hypothetical protein
MHRYLCVMLTLANNFSLIGPMSCIDNTCVVVEDLTVRESWHLTRNHSLKLEDKETSFLQVLTSFSSSVLALFTMITSYLLVLATALSVVLAAYQVPESDFTENGRMIFLHSRSNLDK